jgi:hypothetical protein
MLDMLDQFLLDHIALSQPIRPARRDQQDQHTMHTMHTMQSRNLARLANMTSFQTSMIQRKWFAFHPPGVCFEKLAQLENSKQLVTCWPTDLASFVRHVDCQELCATIQPSSQPAKPTQPAQPTQPKPAQPVQTVQPSAATTQSTLGGVWHYDEWIPDQPTSQTS